MFTARTIGVAAVTAESFLSQFLLSPAMARATTRAASCAPYLASLQDLVRREGANLSITETKYSFQNDTHVRLFDIRVKQRFEDDVVERIYREWNATNNNNTNQQPATVCPLRRGMCVGLVNDEALVLAVGNCKMFYAAPATVEDALTSLPNCAELLLCEKANGEYTMLSSSSSPLPNLRWLTFGSKNVRLTLPFDSRDHSVTTQAMDSLYALLDDSNNNSNAEQDTAAAGSGKMRFSYLREMIPLWLAALKTSPRVLEELDQGTTLVGEQVGVHAHIYTGYAQPEIRLFASLRHDELAHTVGCNLAQLRAKQLGMRLVEWDAFALPQQRAECRARLEQISQGPMQEFGEGVVVYAYDSGGALFNMYKFKCQEYAFDRKLRTLLAPVAGELYKQGPLSRLRLRQEADRITKSLQQQQTTAGDVSVRQLRRIQLVPALVGFLDRHQSTQYCSHFLDNFVHMVQRVAADEDNSYSQWAKQHFMRVEDAFLPQLEAFLDEFQDVQVTCRPVGELAGLIIDAWQDKGGLKAFPLVGITASVGSGKTAVLREVERQLVARGVPCVLCDRDAYAVDGVPPHVAHQQWTKHIASVVAAGVQVVLVGNTFAGGLANQLEKLTRARVLLFGFQDAHQSLFSLECLRRLARRTESFADGSTLTMQAGSRVVAEKFFSFANSDVMKRRVRDGSGVLLPSPVVVVVEEDGVVTTASARVKRLKDALTALSKAVQAEARKTSSSNNKSNKRAKAGGGEEGAATQDYNNNDGGFKPAVPRAMLIVDAMKDDSAAAPPPPPERDVKFIGLLPVDADCRRLHALCSTPALIRTDAHLTLVFHPTQQDMDMAQSAFAVGIGGGEAAVRLVCTHKYTVTTTMTTAASLEFVRLAPASQEDEAKMAPWLQGGSSVVPHITLGSSDYNLLPSVTSKLVLEKKEEMGAAEECVIEFGGARGSLRVEVKPLMDATMVIQAKLVWFCGK